MGKKFLFFLGGLQLLFVAGCEPDNAIIIDKPVQENIIDLSKEPAIVGELLETGLTCLLIETEHSEAPTCDYVDHPEGAMGKSITNATKVPGRLRVVKNMKILYDSGDYTSDNSGITLRIRGNSTAYSEKKPYKVQLQKKEDLLFRGDDKYKDKSWVLIKDSEAMTTNNEMSLKPFIGMKVCEIVGLEYVPQGMYVNVVLNGDYQGVYFLSENVKRNKDCRVNVSKDGFIFEFDPYWWNEPICFDTNITSNSFRYTVKYPDQKEINDENIRYIKSFMMDMEAKIDSNASDYIDFDSFAKWVLAHDFLGSNDTGGINKFFTKYDRTSTTKLKMGPIWDFDGIMNIRNAFPNIHILKGYNLYFDQLFAITDFLNIYKEEGKAICGVFYGRICSEFDAFLASDEAVSLNKSRVFEQQRWGVDYKTVEDNINQAKSYFKERTQWLQNEITQL